MIVAKIPRIAIKKKAGVNESYLSIRIEEVLKEKKQ